MSIWNQLYAALLNAVRYIGNMFDILAGISPIEYDGEQMSIFDLFFTNSAVSVIFWGITVIGMALALLFSAIAVTRSMADLNLKRTMGDTLGQIGRTMLTFLITPMMVLSIFQIASIVLSKTDELFYIANGGYTLDATLFALTAKNAALEDPSVVNKFATGELQYDNAVHVTENLDQGSIMTWLGIPLTIVLIVMYMICLCILAVRLFMLIVLYLVSPLFVSSMALDDGTKYKAWRQALFGKVFSGFALVIALKLFVYIVVPFLVGDVALSDSAAGDIALKLLFAVGAVYAMYKSSGTLVSIISPRTESEDAMVMGAIVGGVKKVALLAQNAAKSVINAGLGAARVAGGDVAGGAKQMGGAALDAAKTAGGEAMNAMNKADGKG